MAAAVGEMKRWALASSIACTADLSNVAELQSGCPPPSVVDASTPARTVAARLSVLARGACRFWLLETQPFLAPSSL